MALEDKVKTIDDYISKFPDGIQDILVRLRQIIKKEAPMAEETINYDIPTFVLNGNLVHFAAFKKHIGFIQHLQVFLNLPMNSRNTKPQKGL